jgi:hypothetical protein
LKFFRLLALCSVSLIMIPALAHADDLVMNGNFTDGSAGWIDNNGQWYISNSYASTGCVGSDCITGPTEDRAYLYQDLSTVAGNTYTLTFAYDPGDGAPNELESLFGGIIVSDLVNIGIDGDATYTVSGLVATSSVTELEFLGRQDPGFDQLTNISVATTGISAQDLTPEPESIVLLGTGVLGIGGVARKRFFRA